MNAFVTLLLTGLVLIGVDRDLSSETARQREVQQTSSDTKWIGKRAPEVADGEWINSKPLKLVDLRGRVVLLEFWTYGCYNCRNTIPSMNKWYKKFSDSGLVIIGVHTPEFEHEKDLSKVREQTAKLGIKYAVVTDKMYRTWRAYDQEYWPVLYLIDRKGIIRYVHVGEGNYDETERQIEFLLRFSS